jgi:hypothetical protein
MARDVDVGLGADPLVAARRQGPSQPSSGPRLRQTESKASLCVDHKCTAVRQLDFSTLLRTLG